MQRFSDISEIINEFRKSGYEDINLHELYAKSQGYDRPFRYHSKTVSANPLAIMKKNTEKGDIYLSVSSDERHPFVYFDLWKPGGIMSRVLKEHNNYRSRIRWDGTRIIYLLVEGGLEFVESIRKEMKVLVRKDFLDL